MFIYYNNNNILYTLSDIAVEAIYRPIYSSILNFILTITTIKKPNTLKQALEGPDSLY